MKNDFVRLRLARNAPKLRRRIVRPNHMLVAALQYAKLEYGVFPGHSVRDGQCTCGNDSCSHPGKHPWTKHGLHDATTDIAEVQRSWAKHPDANPCVKTGLGLLVVDVDAGSGGFDTLKFLEEENGKLPDTVTVESGGGGRHFWLRYEDRIHIPSRANALGSGIDSRADGGSIIVPPSIPK